MFVIRDKKMTEKECYENIKRMYELYGGSVIMHPDEWLLKRRLYLGREKECR